MDSEQGEGKSFCTILLVTRSLSGDSFAGDRRRIDKKFMPGNSDHRGGDSIVPQESASLTLGALLRFVHAHRLVGFHVLFKLDYRNVSEYYDSVMRRAGGRLRCSYWIGVHAYAGQQERQGSMRM